MGDQLFASSADRAISRGGSQCHPPRPTKAAHRLGGTDGLFCAAEHVRRAEPPRDAMVLERRFRRIVAADEAIEAHIAHAAKAPSYFSRMHPLSDRRRRAEGQVRHGLERPRRSLFDGRRHRSGPPQAGQLKEWATPYWKGVHPYDLAGVYTNFMMGGDGEERIKVSFGVNYPRLKA